jgi:hypothetical protein
VKRCQSEKVRESGSGAWLGLVDDCFPGIVVTQGTRHVVIAGSGGLET